MNRELKFRFWDKRNDEWWQPTYNASEGELEDLTITKNGQIMMRDMTAHPQIVDDKFEVMQYTGLKDNNGKEIYEGDVVEIYLYEYASVDETQKITIGENKGGRNFYRDVGYLQNINSKHVEIIGNMYENPELIN